MPLDMTSDTMYKVQSRRFLYSRPRPRTLVVLAAAMVMTYLVLFRSPSAGYHVIPWQQDLAPKPAPEPEPEKPLTEEERRRLEKEEYEQSLRDTFKAEYESAKR